MMAPKNSVLLAAILLASNLTSARADQTPVNQTLETQSSLKSVNIEVSPLSAMVGVYGVDATIGVSDHVAVGPTLSYYNVSGLLVSGFFEDARATGYSVGTKAKFFLSGPRFTDSWVVSPSVSYISLHCVGTLIDFFSASNRPSFSKDESATIAGAVVGHEWYYSSGISLGALVGASYYYENAGQTQYSDGMTRSYSARSGVALALQFNLGYTF